MAVGTGAEKNLDDVARWLDEVMPAEPPMEELREMFTDWMEEQAPRARLERRCDQVV